MTASTSKFTDKVLQNIKEVNNKVIEADLDIENRIRSVIENKIFSKNAIEKWKKYYVEYWSELKKIAPGPTHPADKHKSLADDYFHDSIDQLDFKNDDNQQEDLSDDKIKQEIKAIMEETGFVWESVMDYMSDDFIINNVEEKEIYSEVIGEYHSWKKEEDADLYAYTEELINLKIKELI